MSLLRFYRGTFETAAKVTPTAGAVSTVKLLLVASRVKLLLLNRRSSYVPAVVPSGILNGKLPLSSPLVRR